MEPIRKIARITVTNEYQGVRVYDLNDGEKLNVGREDSNQIVILDNRVSRVHACFFAKGNKCYVSDLFSRNGTIVNGEPLVGDLELHNQDVVNIGSSVLVIEIGIKERALASSDSDVTSTGGFTNTKIATVLFWSEQDFSNQNIEQIEQCINQSSGRALLRSKQWLMAAWPGTSLNRTAGLILASSFSVFKELSPKIESLRICIFTMTALLEEKDGDWRIDLLGDPRKICDEYYERAKLSPAKISAEQSIIKRAPEGWKSELIATHKLKNDFKPKTFFRIISGPEGLV